MNTFKSFTIGMVLVLLAGTANAGRVGGPTGKRDTVLANSSDSYTITFTEREEARVLVKGDGSADLDCFVYDNNGHLVASDADLTDVCFLTWTPAWTGKFRIVISNRGSNDNEYTIETN